MLETESDVIKLLEPMKNSINPVTVRSIVIFVVHLTKYRTKIAYPAVCHCLSEPESNPKGQSETTEKVLKSKNNACNFA